MKVAVMYFEAKTTKIFLLCQILPAIGSQLMESSQQELWLLESFCQKKEKKS